MSSISVDAAGGGAGGGPTDAASAGIATRNLDINTKKEGNDDSPDTIDTIAAVNSGGGANHNQKNVSSSSVPQWFSPCSNEMTMMEDHFQQQRQQQQHGPLHHSTTNINDDDDDIIGRRRSVVSMTPVHARLFDDEEDVIDKKQCIGNTKEEKQNDDGLSGRKEVICTRLNFNSLSPVPTSTTVKKKLVGGGENECHSIKGDKWKNRAEAVDYDGDNTVQGETTPIPNSRDLFQQNPSSIHNNTSQDLTQPYDHSRTYSLESSLSNYTPHTPFRNVSRTSGGGDVDDTVTSTTGGPLFTPSFHAGSSSVDATVIHHRRNHHHQPMAPREVHLQFHLDSSQCSPIEAHPEEEGRNHNIAILRQPSNDSSSEMLIEAAEDNDCRTKLMQPHLDSAPSSPATSKKKSWRLPPSSRFSGSGSVGDDMVLFNAGESESCGLSISAGSSSSSGKTRKNRPMPDMSAFDVNATPDNNSSSKSRESFGDGRMTGHDGPGTSASGAIALSSDAPQHMSPKLLCPPTPVRTPAWAHNESLLPPYSRADSLIATKVLAACPPQVLDGLSSLENSLLEDDDDGDNDDCGQNQGIGRVFSAVEEGNEDDSPGKGEITFKELQQNDNDDSIVSHSLRKDSGDDSIRSGSDSFDYSMSPRERTHPSTTPCVSNNSRLSVPQTEHRIGRGGQVGSVISFDSNFEHLGLLGKGTFADVYKVQSKADGCLYAVKRNRRQFRGKRDRDRAMAEVQTMQRLQSACAPEAHANSASNNNGKGRNSYGLFLLFFIRAWQEDGYFFCQTELCCRESCLQMIKSLSSQWNTAKRKYPSLLRNLPSQSPNMSIDEDSGGRLVPESSVWKLCHDVSAGLSHIHSHGMVHYDIKPTNVYFVLHNRLGTMCKIGDFGMAGEAGVVEDGQEGDTKYMARELLSSTVKHPSADMFSLGLTLYEVALTGAWELPTEGPRWHELRSGSHTLRLAPTRSQDLSNLILRMLSPEREKRPSANDILDNIRQVKQASMTNDIFLTDYVRDVEHFDLRQERLTVSTQREDYQRRFTPTGSLLSQNTQGIEPFLNEVRTPTTESGSKFFSP